jgi:hypothetical protein
MTKCERCKKDFNYPPVTMVVKVKKDNIKFIYCSNKCYNPNASEYGEIKEDRNGNISGKCHFK